MKKILILVVVALLSATGYGYYLFQKPSKDIATTKPYLSTIAPQLIAKFGSGQTSSSSELLSKVIQVSGKVTDIEKGKESIIIVLNEGIKCEIILDKNPPFVKGDYLTVKGIFSGFDDMFNEISLTKCYIVL